MCTLQLCLGGLFLGPERHFYSFLQKIFFFYCRSSEFQSLPTPSSLLCFMSHFLIHICLSNSQKLPTSDITCFTPRSAFPCQKGYTASRILALCKKKVSSSPDAENLNIIFCLVCQIETRGNEPLHQRQQSPGLEVLRTP